MPKKNTSPDSTQACWGKHSPNATGPKKNQGWAAQHAPKYASPSHPRGKGFLFDVFLFFFGARPSANKMQTWVGKNDKVLSWQDSTYVFWYRLGSMLVSAANQSHTFKASLQATAHGARTTGFCFGFHVGFQLFQGMGRVTMGKVPWRSMLASMLASVFVSSFQGMGEVTAFRAWGRSPWERYRGDPYWVPYWLHCWFPAARVWDGKDTMGSPFPAFRV